MFSLLYTELHRLADRQLRGGNSGLTLSTTTLVHEAWLSMAGKSENLFPDRARFFAYASRAMRGLVVDHARRRCALKRGRHLQITLEENNAFPEQVKEASEELPALGEALEELQQLDPDLAELVDLHFFGGFSFGEIAGFRRVSERTVQRDWRKARLLLHRSLRA